MMGSSFGVDGYGVSSDVRVDTTSVPWIIVTIKEYDFRVVIEVLAWFSTSEEVKSPVVLGSESISFLAEIGVAGFIPVVPGEAALCWVITLRHWELAAGLSSPSTGIQSTFTTSIHVEAFASLIVVSEAEHGSKPSNVRVVEAINHLVLNYGISSQFTGFEDGPGRQLANEISFIWVVNHRHCSKTISDCCKQVLNIACSVQSAIGAQVKFSAQLFVSTCLECSLVKGPEAHLLMVEAILS